MKRLFLLHFAIVLALSAGLSCDGPSWLGRL